MLTEVKMPCMGATMEEGVIVSWRLAEGDRISAGDILADIESDKSTFEFESPCDGVIRKFLAKEGETCPVQSTIAVIGDPHEEIPAEYLTDGASQGTCSPVAAVAAPAAPTAPSESKPTGRPRISPRARKLAEELAVDIERVSGTGPGGRIESSDIEAAAKA